MRGQLNLYPRFAIFALVVFITSTDAQRKNMKKTCINPRTTKCTTNQFTCLNEACVARSSYCDSRQSRNCGDSSDEKFCGRSDVPLCPTDPPFTKCGTSNKCIPDEWICDGTKDCPSGEDEENCDVEMMERTVKQKALKWVYDRTNSTSLGSSWDKFLHKAVVALFLSDPSSNGSNFQQDIAKDVSIQFLSRLSQKNLTDVPTSDLAAFVNAMLVTCLNPRRFHGMDLVEELRKRANEQTYTNPYVLLTLCNAGDTITDEDKAKLAAIFRTDLREIWTDMKAMVVMTLSCVAKQPGNSVDEEMMKEFTADLISRQYKNGSVENVQTTALVLQALYSAAEEVDLENFDEDKALLTLLTSQDPEGSFGSFMETYYVLPVLNCRSLVNISTHHCKPAEIIETSGNSLRDLANRAGPKIRVQYSLWLGNQIDMERTMALKVPVNMSFYNIMEIAAEIDDVFKFEYVVKDRKPYVNEIFKVLDDPELNKFWFLYTLKDGELTVVKKSPADVIPKNNDHLIMWYRSGYWMKVK